MDGMDIVMIYMHRSYILAHGTISGYDTPLLRLLQVHFGWILISFSMCRSSSFGDCQNSLKLPFKITFVVSQQVISQ
jgi:hypothetical protein